MIFVPVPLTMRIQLLARAFSDELPERYQLHEAEPIKAGDRTTPAFRNGGVLLNSNFSVPDRFTEKTGATATLFVRSGNDLVRVTTSVKKQDGTRAIGTVLDRSHPAYLLLLSGQPYMGYATIFGKQYMTRYDPVMDAAGKLIGARYVGLDVSALRSTGMAMRTAAATFALSAIAFLVFWHLARALPQPGGGLEVGVLGLIACIAIAACVYGLVHIQASRPMANCMLAAQRIAGGDLSTQAPVYRRDDIGKLLQGINSISVGLAEVVARVRHSSDSICTASDQIAGGTADLSRRTQTQASSLEQTVATMEELTATVRQNANHAAEAATLVASAAQLAKEGGGIMRQVISNMGDIKASSHRIEDIIGIMDEIAFQTNILALNASVEAARAGEHGRGFSVVATEVRALAQRSADAAKEIRQLISSSVQTVDAGSALVDGAGIATGKIAEAIQRASGLMADISTASVAQSRSIEEINRTMEMMDHATQRNAALVEESAAAAMSMKEQAQIMSKAVAAFKMAE